MPQAALVRFRLRFCPVRFTFFFPLVGSCFARAGCLPEDLLPPFCVEDSALATTLAVLAARVPATDPATRANLIMRVSGVARFLSGMISP
jgi:hypothetical protein